MNSLSARRSLNTGFTLVEIMITVLIIGTLLAIAVPNFVRSREQTRRKACIGNLRAIDWAKDAYIMDKRLDFDAEPSANDLYPADGSGYLRSTPQCPSSGTYTINKGSEVPVCSRAVADKHVLFSN